MPHVHCAESFRRSCSYGVGLKPEMWKAQNESQSGGL